MMSPILLTVALAAGCGQGVDIRPVSDRTFDVEAKNVPVNAVLECLSERAGFKLTIDPGAAIRQPLTLRLDGRTAAQSVDRILEGLSVNYAMSRDPDGGRVVMLMITGKSGPPTSLAASPSGTSSLSADPSVSPRRLPPFRPPTEGADPEPFITEPQGQFQNEGGALQHPFVPPMPSPLYPEAQPLSPLSLRGGHRVPAPAHAASGRPAGLRGNRLEQTLR